MFVQNKISLEIKLEVFENELNIAKVGKEPEVNILLSVDLPMFDCWEFHAQEGLVEVSG